MVRLPARHSATRLARRTRATISIVAGVALAASAGAVAAQTPGLGWLVGDWQVRYEDSGLGPVTGYARISSPSSPGSPIVPDRAEIILVHPKSGERYTLEGGFFDLIDGKVHIPLHGNSPPSGVAAQNSSSVGAKPMEFPAAATLNLELEGVEARAFVPGLPERVSLTVVFPVPDESRQGTLSGRWQYQGRDRAWMRGRRGGTFDRQADTVSGPETWTRLDPTISFVAAADGQPAISDLSTTRVRPSAGPDPDDLSTAEARLLHGPDTIGTYWLSIVGTNLPIAADRRATVEFHPQTMPGTGEPRTTVEWTGRKRANPRLPGVLDIRVALRNGFDAAPKTFDLDGAPGVWMPDLPDFEPVAIRYVRRKTETEFERLETIDIGDVFYVEAEYEEAPAAPRQTFLTRTGSGAGVRYHLERTAAPASPADGARAGDGARPLYRSGRLLLLEPGDPEPRDGDVRAQGETGLASTDVTVIRARAGATLETAEFDQPPSAGAKLMAEATVREAPPSLWRGALNRARQCWETGQSQSEFGNFIVVDGVRLMTVPVIDLDIYYPLANPQSRTLNVRLEEHAAALLVRDELRQTLGRYVRQVTRPNPVDANAAPDERRRQLGLWERTQEAETEALIRHAERGGTHPLLHMPVQGRLDTSPDTELRELIVDDIVRYDDRTEDDRRRFRQMARVRIAEARGRMSERGSRSLDHIRSVNPCDVKALLFLIRTGMKPVVASLVPKLVRPRRGDEPAYPRHVPDRIARTYVAGIETLASAIKAQEDYASADTDVLLAMGAVAGLYANASMRTYQAARAVAGATGASGAGAEIASAAVAEMVRAGMTAMEIYDAYQVYKDMGDWRAAMTDERFAWGASAVAGTERLTAAQQERRAAAFKAALGGVTSIAPGIAEGLAVGRLDLDVVPATVRTMIAQRAVRNGPDALSGPERIVFDRMADRARRAAADGRAHEISPLDRQALALDEAERVRRTSTASAERPDPLPGPDTLPPPATAATLPDGAATRPPPGNATTLFDRPDPLPGPDTLPPPATAATLPDGAVTRPPPGNATTLFDRPDPLPGPDTLPPPATAATLPDGAATRPPPGNATTLFDRPDLLPGPATRPPPAGSSPTRLDGGLTRLDPPFAPPPARPADASPHRRADPAAASETPPTRIDGGLTRLERPFTPPSARPDPPRTADTLPPSAAVSPSRDSVTAPRPERPSARPPRPGPETPPTGGDANLTPLAEPFSPPRVHWADRPDGHTATVETSADGVPAVRFSDGRPDIALSEFLGAGSTSAAYRAPGSATAGRGMVVKLTSPGEGALDAAGAAKIGEVADPSRLRTPAVFERFPVRQSPTLRIGGEGRSYRDGTVTLMEEGPRSFGDLVRRGEIPNVDGHMTSGQVIAYDRGLAALNERGYAWLDNKRDNFTFEELGPPGSDNWVLVILDPGAIVPMRASGGRTAAQNARDLQRAAATPGDDAMRVPQAFRNAVHQDDLARRFDSRVDWDRLNRETGGAGRETGERYRTLQGPAPADPGADPVTGRLPYNPQAAFDFPEVEDFRRVQDRSGSSDDAEETFRRTYRGPPDAGPDRRGRLAPEPANDDGTRRAA